MNSFYIKVTIVAVILLLLTLFVEHNTDIGMVGPMAYGLLVFFFVFSIAVILLSQNALTAKNHRLFVNALTGSMVAKVLLTAFVVLVFGLIERPKSILIVVPLFVYYTTFTVLEVIEFLRLNKKYSSK